MGNDGGIDGFAGWVHSTTPAAVDCLVVRFELLSGFLVVRFAAPDVAQRPMRVMAFSVTFC